MINIPTSGAHTDVVLVYPKTGIDLDATIAPPHAVLSLAAPLLRKGYKVKIVDQRIDPDWQIHLKEFLSQKPICVGISTMTGTQIDFALQASRLIRQKTDGKIPIIWGGAHPSSIPEQTAKNDNVDVVCVGEGDITFPEIVDALKNRTSLHEVLGILFKENGQIITTPPRPLLDVETLLPVPWELIDVEKYIHRDFYVRDTYRSLDIGQTSRGCPFECGFCSSATLRQRKWRAMSVEKSLSVILDPVKRFNLDSIWIRDDEFFIDPKRVYQICKGIVDSGVKIKWYTSGTRVDVFTRLDKDVLTMIRRSGADTLKLGAESGSNRMLKLMCKGIAREDTLKANLKAKEFGFIPVYALMMGFPTETFEDINQTIDLFVQLKKENPQAEFEIIGAFTALPKTPLFSLALEHGLRPPEKLEDWADWLSDEYDLKGKKLPWFSAKERKYIGNITYMSLLANASEHVINGISNDILRALMKFIFIPIRHFERFKLGRKWYHFAPEMGLVRFLRKKVFYRRRKSIIK